jgi:hypothetical protein
MTFWVLENTMHNYAKIHLSDCGSCNNGQGPRIGHIGLWLGPFPTYSEALATAKNVRKATDSYNCKKCKPQSFV